MYLSDRREIGHVVGMAQAIADAPDIPPRKAGTEFLRFLARAVLPPR
jgi:hypothetical protein